MCRSPSTGGTGLTQPGGIPRRCGMVGNHRPKSRGRDRRPRGELRGLAAAPAPVPTREAPATGKWRDNIRRGGSGTSQSERTTGNPGGSHLPLPGTTTGKESWAGADVTADSLAAARAGMKLLENRSLSESKMGDHGDRLINGREVAVNQGWRIVIPAPGPGTNSRRRNVEYR